MYFQHIPALWARFPQLVPGVLVAEGIHPTADVSDLLPPWFERARARLAQQPESDMPEVAAWRRVYSEMGLKPTKYRSAAEALLRRFKREDDLPRLHPLVDVCNAISLGFSLPVAVFDVAHVDRFLEVTIAQGTEQYAAFSGEVETPPAGEIIFADASGHAHARRWTFRQSKQSVVNDSTERVLIVTEAMHESAPADIQALTAALAEAITQVWTAPTHHTILTADNPRLEF